MDTLYLRFWTWLYKLSARKLNRPTNITVEEMEERWALFLAGKIADLERRWGHRQVRTVLQEDADVVRMGRDTRLRDREARMRR